VAPLKLKQIPVTLEPESERERENREKREIHKGREGGRRESYKHGTFSSLCL
jgi:hypothetical protein